MSEGIYIGLASPDQVMYSTVDQNTERSGQSSFLKRLAAVCPWLLCALLLAPAVVLGVLYMRTSLNCSMSCVEELRANNSILNKEKDQLQRDYNSLIIQNNQLQKRECRHCPEGWQLRNSKCYYISTENKSWKDSRSECLKQGADLVIIESKEEQEFIFKYTIDGNSYWIGLSDSATEGNWLWVDGTPLQDDKEFWMTGQPNDYNRSEDCAGTWPGENKWFDAPCKCLETYALLL
ncbi:hypothetical protein AAFF_G00418190 [Aldrovandia affinis]|uniref:C-type lectin domain-containing protein n=1 Tax=Aldrovandia affinis TaxID=143900 RepID=A0AAD7SAA4_9TELE|nr:hypothetical protein AAFF_G00418190 [Aldrovandia affinis]